MVWYSRASEMACGRALILEPFPGQYNNTHANTATEGRTYGLVQSSGFSGAGEDVDITEHSSRCRSKFHADGGQQPLLPEIQARNRNNLASYNEQECIVIRLLLWK